MVKLISISKKEFIAMYQKSRIDYLKREHENNAINNGDYITYRNEIINRIRKGTFRRYRSK